MNEPTLFIAALIGICSGVLGSMLGIGGGIFIVPFLTLVLGLPMQVVISSSLITIVANACTATMSYLKSNLTNIRLGFIMLSTTVPGAIIGSIIAIYISSAILRIIFGILLLYIALYMLMRSRMIDTSIVTTNIPEHPLKYSWRNEQYYEPSLQTMHFYTIRNLPIGLLFSFIAGCFSSLLGIGGGVIQVPTMNVLMKIPFKIVIATSSLMISITAATGSIVYLIKGYIMPALVAPLVIGAFLGAIVGTKLLKNIKSRQLQLTFSFVLILTSVLMIFKGLMII